MVNGYKGLLENKSFPLSTPKDIRLIFDELVSRQVNESGTGDMLDGDIFRNKPVYLYKASGKILHQGIEPETAIFDALSKALNILSNTDIDFLIRVSLFHYFLGYIHPFYNGNGRVNRFITSSLINKEFSNVMGYHMSGEIKNNKKIYYDAFERTSSTYNKGDLGTFVFMFLGIIEKAFIHVHEQLGQLWEKFDIYKKLLENQTKFDEGEIKLIYIFVQNTLFSVQGINLYEVTNYVGKSLAWVRKKIYKFESLELFTKIRSGRNYLYQIDLEILEKILDK